MKIRVGFGFDVHQLEEGKDFYLGGIKVPHTKGAVGHSDADVLIHTICDALLGAANLRDIGFDPIESFDDPEKVKKEIIRLEDQMYKYAKNLEFEEAASYRDRVEELKQKLLIS